jgi:DNA-binding HxlR family transcriptional regulator
MTNKRQQEYTCAMEAALSVISGKWKMKILNQLRDGAKRYSEINRSIPGMTQKMLSQQLKELEEDGIVNRKVYPEVPPKVEYSFTELGAELMGVFKALEIWGNHFMTGSN